MRADYLEAFPTLLVKPHDLIPPSARRPRHTAGRRPPPCLFPKSDSPPWGRNHWESERDEG